MDGRAGGSLWEWFSSRVTARPAQERLAPGVALFVQAALTAQHGDASGALALADRVLGEPGVSGLVVSVVHSLRGAQLIGLGRPLEAIAAAQSATDAARRLDLADGDNVVVLARALSGEAMLLAQARRFDEALAASEEAVRLVGDVPDEDGHARADALTALLASLTFLDRRAEAVPLAREIVAIRRGQADPDRLGNALSHLAGLLSATGEPAQAFAVGEEAVDLLRRDGHPLSLVNALNAHSGRTGDAGRSLELVEEAALVARGLDRGDAHVRRGLSSALTYRATYLRALGRVAEQVESAREAVALRRSLPQDVEANPSSITGPLYFLGDGLLQVSIGHARAGDFRSALDVNAEAVDVFLELDRLAPGRHGNAVGTVLTNRGNMLVQSGRLDEGVAVQVQAVDALRAASRDPARDNQLAMALNNLTSAALRTGRLDDAVASATEAAQIRERLFEDEPERMRAPFASAVNTLAEAFLESGRLAEASAMAEWSGELLATVSVEQTGQHELYHAANADTHSRVLSALGDVATARAQSERAVSLARALVRRYPGQADFLDRLERRLAEMTAG